MNWGKRFLTTAALFGILASGMVGCNKSSDNSSSNIQGNVGIDSANNITSTDVLNGMTVTVALSAIYSNNSSYGGYGTNSPVTFNINVNGSGGQATTTTQVGSQVNFAYLGSNYSVAAAYQYIDAMDVALVLWISNYPSNSTQGQIKQIGVIKNLSTGAIRALSGQVGYVSGVGTLPTPGITMLPTASTLVAQLISVMK